MLFTWLPMCRWPYLLCTKNLVLLQMIFILSISLRFIAISFHLFFNSNPFLFIYSSCPQQFHFKWVSIYQLAFGFVLAPLIMIPGIASDSVKTTYITRVKQSHVRNVHHFLSVSLGYVRPRNIVKFFAGLELSLAARGRLPLRCRW